MPLYRNQAARVLALELGATMMAQDEKPSRFERARYKLVDILDRSKDYQTALIGYAGEAFVAAPLTDDIGTVRNLVDSLDPSTMPVAGNRAARCDRAGGKTDSAGRPARGRHHPARRQCGRSRAVAAARKAHAQGLTVSVLGIGSPAGAPVALAQGDFLKDDNGNVIVARRDDASLRAVAEAGGGRYATLTADARDIDALLVDRTSAAAQARRCVGSRRASLPRARAGATAVRGCCCCWCRSPRCAFRRGWLMAIALAVLAPSPRAQAASFTDLVAALRSAGGRGARARRCENSGERRAVAGLARQRVVPRRRLCVGGVRLRERQRRRWRLQRRQCAGQARPLRRSARRVRPRADSRAGHGRCESEQGRGRGMAQATAEIEGQVLAESEVEVGRFEGSETVAAGQVAAGSEDRRKDSNPAIEIGSGSAESAGSGFVAIGSERRRKGKAERLAAEVRRREGQAAILARHRRLDDRAAVRRRSRPKASRAASSSRRCRRRSTSRSRPARSRRRTASRRPPSRKTTRRRKNARRSSISCSACPTIRAAFCAASSCSNINGASSAETTTDEAPVAYSRSR